jgi:KUP system potassium uptake protein
VLPIAVVIITALFFFQSGGTARAGKIFGPITTTWFVALAALGIAQIVRVPEVFAAVDPRHAVHFFGEHGRHGFVVLGSVVLVVTGGESLYTDLGHFGARPIRLAWFALVYPALLLNYFGQGALLLRDPSAAAHPFFRLAPEWALIPMVALATMATIIASQAVISGAFSVTLQAIQLGFCPRLRVRHTSAHEIGQVYVPAINWTLLALCLVLVISFRSSGALAAAYGIAVTGTMVITSTIFGVVAHERWKWPLWRVVPLVALFLAFELSFLGANLLKLFDGGWLPLLVGGAVFTVFSTWKRGRRLVYDRTTAGADPVGDVIARVRAEGVTRVPGTAVFLSGSPGGRARGAAPQPQAQPRRPRADGARDRAHSADARGPRRRARRRRGARGRVLPRRGAVRVHGGPVPRAHAGERRGARARRGAGARAGLHAGGRDVLHQPGPRGGHPRAGDGALARAPVRRAVAGGRVGG